MSESNKSTPPDFGLLRFTEEDERIGIGRAGDSLRGLCSRCHREVDNHDPLHRVSAIGRGGRGVECVIRCDIEPHEAGPLGPQPKRAGE